MHQQELHETLRKSLRRSAKTAHLADLTCHCPGTRWPTDEGHPINAKGCQSNITSAAPLGKMGRQFWNGSMPSPAVLSTAAADIQTELAKTAKMPAQRRQHRVAAAIHRAAATEWRAQDARTNEERHKIRLRNAKP